MIWSLLLPLGFLLLIILLFLLTRKKTYFLKLKSFLPFLLLLFLFSLLLSLLKSGWVSHLFYSENLVSFLEICSLFFTLVLSIKTLIFLIFDFIFEKKQIKYPRLIKDVAVIILYIIGILLIGKYYFNIELTVVLASSAVLTVVVGFALQDILGDLFSGIALNLEESLKISDWIKIGDYEGKIEQFRWRGLKIRTTDNILVLIPNRIASKGEVNRFGHPGESFALRLKMGVSYKNSPDLVIASLLEVLSTIPAILNSPPPIVMVNEFADSAILYDIKFWITDYSLKDPIKSEIRRKTWYVFKRKGIHIPYPTRDVYIKDFHKENKPELPTLAGLTREQVVETLHKNDVLKTINKKQLENLAENIEIRLYGKGEILIKEGEEGHYFYHFLEGEAEVLKNNQVVGGLKADDYVGEMSLFTGEKTSADVRVTRESRVLCISSGKFRETIKLNENVARKLAEVIALRKAQLDELKKREEDSHSKAIKKVSESIFLRIKKYFSLN